MKKIKQNYFLKNISCLKISQPKLNQIKHVGAVPESSWWAIFKTAIGFLIWWRFNREKV